MRVSALTAVLAIGLTTAMIGGAAAAPNPGTGGLCKVVCSPAPQQAKAGPKPAPVKPMPVRHIVRHRVPRHVGRHGEHHVSHQAASSDYYSYRETETAQGEWHGAWHQAPDDAEIPGPQGPVPYGPGPYSQSGGAYAEGYAQEYQGSGPPCDCGPGLQIDRGGWTGGVGYAAANEGFMDGYGVMHYASSQNGPTYNSYGQSFQFNPSRAGPFQPRMMGGFAPGAGMGYGPRR